MGTSETELSSGFKSGSKYRELREMVDEKALFVSPPYPTIAERTAFISGYETALSDMALGRLTRTES